MKTPFAKILTTRSDPLDALRTTAFIVQRARFVKIDHDAIERAADALAETRVAPPAWNYDYHFFDGTERTVNYLFLLDALNFCFWGEPKWGIVYRGKKLDGYWALAASLKRALENDPHFADADSLARLAPQDLARALRGKGMIPLFAERWRAARELGAILRDHWGSRATTLIAGAQRDATRLAQMLADNFASFNDVAVYEIREGEADLPHSPRLPVSHSSRATTKIEVHFYKRAQILVADLWGAFGGKAWGAFDNIETLTAFADYKLPQILRAWKILHYAPSLARKIDAQIELAVGSPAEIEIRAATLWAVECLRDALARRGRKLWSIQVDWILWQASRALDGAKPYHRVRTIYY